MPFILKVNMRHSATGPTIRTIRRFNNFTFNKKFNSLASTFSFDYYFDPTNRESAEIICVSHVHECILYYTTNTDPDYQPKPSEMELTGYMLYAKFRDDGKPQFVRISGYSKPGVLTDCDIPPDEYPLEIDGLSFYEIIRKIIKPFSLGLVVDKKATAVNKKFVVEEDDKEVDEDDEDEDMGKTAAETSQNIASYLSDLAKQRNIVLSHTVKGEVYITTPNTKGSPVFTLDFTDGANSTIYKKIPGIECDLEFNAQSLHSHITIKQQADDDEESDGAEVTIRNPLLPVRAVYRPKTHVISSGGETTVNEAAKYELGKEIRESIQLTIKMGIIELNGKLLDSNKTIKVRNPNLFLYNLSTWFIEGVDINVDNEKEWSTLHCVLPFGYDFISSGLKNVFVDPHNNLPRF